MIFISLRPADLLLPHGTKKWRRVQGAEPHTREVDLIGLPNANRAVIDPRKIKDYLLCATHPKGGPKCAFFESFGFRLADWQRLRAALLKHAGMHPVRSVIPISFGIIYEVVGPLPAPDGRSPTILVAWVIRSGEAFPRLVTAVPA